MKEKGVNKIHFEYEGFVGKQANDYVTKLNMEINKLIAERVDENTKELQETVKFLINDNIKRYSLARIFGMAFIIILIILIYILIK